jgi:hypothetical protein
MLARTAAAALALADKRKKSIKAIKAKVRQLGLDDASYRAMLQAHTGRASCKDCTLPELDRVCHYLTTQGASNPKAPSRPGKTLAAERVPLRGQVDKLMVDLSQKTSITKPLAYVNAILVKNHWCSDLDMASPEILRKLVGALSRTLNGRVAGTSQASRSQAAHTRR